MHICVPIYTYIPIYTHTQTYMYMCVCVHTLLPILRSFELLKVWGVESIVCLALAVHFSPLLAKIFWLYSHHYSVIQYQALLHPFITPELTQKAPFKFFLTTIYRCYQKLEPKTGDKFSIFYSSFSNTKRFYLTFLMLSLLHIGQATFKSFNCLAQKADSLKEHTSHCCKAQKKKAYSFCFGPL